MSAIADWSIHTRHCTTSLRYYSYLANGGWAYQAKSKAKNQSPLTHAHKLYGPLLVLHGEQDQICPFAQIPPFVRAAESANNTFETKEGAVLTSEISAKYYPGDGHGISKVPHQKDRMSRLSDFFRVHLKPWDFTSKLPKAAKD